MYSNFFGFTEKPFDVTPDPRFLYLSAEHRETLATLLYGIRERRGFIAMVGEVGTGKTLLLNTLLDRLDEHTKVAYIFNSDVTAKQLIAGILVEFGLATTEGTLYKAQAIDRLNRFAIEQLRKGDNVALIVDEAQNLSHRALESLRLLSNLETHRRKLIQIVLSGQPELDAKLNAPELLQLAQRVSLKRYITPLSEAETREYIRHRLAVAGYEGTTLFDRQAQQLIWRYSGGIPRKINILCDNAFLIAYGLKRRKIKEDVVAEAVKDLTWSPFSGNTERSGLFSMDAYTLQRRKRAFRFGLAKAASIILVVGLFFAIGFQIGKREFPPQAESDAVSRSALRTAIGRQSPGPDTANFGEPIPGPVRGVIRRDNKPVPPPEETVSVEIPPIDTAVGSLREPERETDKRAQVNLDMQAAPASSGPTVLAGLPEKAVEASKRTQPELVTAVQTSPEPSSRPKVPPRSSAEGAETVERVERPKRVVVKPGDTLYRIIVRSYGDFTEERLKILLKQNPDITQPDKILIGQAILLPHETGLH